jgi:hypothetical protein
VKKKTKNMAGYISGSISKSTAKERELFFLTELSLAAKGYYPILNPLREDEKNGFDPAECKENGKLRATVLKKDCEWICDFLPTIFVLPTYEKSSGALMEIALGKALGLKIVFLD